MADSNANARLEAFCDAVFAIAMTLLVIDLRLPVREIASTAALWNGLRELTPAIFAFLLSFTIIFITWVNHHAGLKLVRGTSASFIYSNGLLLLTVVFIPFPTSLLGEFLGTDHAAPAVVLYNAVLAVQGMAWILMSGVALRNHLAMNDGAKSQLRRNRTYGYFALILYGTLAVSAFWYPLPVAAMTTATWVFWLVLGVRLKHS